MTRPTELPAHLAERADQRQGLSFAIVAAVLIVCALLVLNGSAKPMEEDW